VLVVPDPSDPFHQARRAGFVAAARELGLANGRTIDDRIVVDPAASGDGPDDVFEACGRLADRIVRERRADAVLAPDDLIATQVCRQFRRRGMRVPDDVAVVGHNNDEGAVLFDPPLTTISFRLAEVAARALDLVIGPAADHTGENAKRARVYEAGDPGDVIVRPKLFVREST
jgi:DNA-binding LacI/PurR family transcriptional regulator